MKKLKARIGLKLVEFGLFVMGLGNTAEYDNEDKENLKRLKELQTKFSEQLK